MTASSNDHFDQTVIRDLTVSRQMLDALRGVLPACHVCGNPSAYKDFEGRWSHQICAGESSKDKRDAKFAARFGKIAPDAGQSDLSDLVVIMRKAEESALAERRANGEGPRALVDQGKFPAVFDTAKFEAGVYTRSPKDQAELDRLMALPPEQRRAATMRHIRQSDPPPTRRSPEAIFRMSEADVYALGSIRADPTNRDALRGELIDRARRANDLADFPRGLANHEPAMIPAHSVRMSSRPCACSRR